MQIRAVSFVTEISDTAIIRWKGQGRYPSENSSIKTYGETNYHLIKKTTAYSIFPLPVGKYMFIRPLSLHSSPEPAHLLPEQFINHHLNMKYPPLWVLYTTLG